MNSVTAIPPAVGKVVMRVLQMFILKCAIIRIPKGVRP